LRAITFIEAFVFAESFIIAADSETSVASQHTDSSMRIQVVGVRLDMKLLER